MFHVNDAYSHHSPNKHQFILSSELPFSDEADFCHAMLCISAAIAVMRCLSVRLSVCLSVTFVDHVKTNKHIFEIFSPSGSHTILVFPYQTGWRYSDGNPPHGGVECRWGIGRNRDSGLIAGYRRLLDVQSAKNIYRRRS